MYDLELSQIAGKLAHEEMNFVTALDDGPNNTGFRLAFDSSHAATLPFVQNATRLVNGNLLDAEEPWIAEPRTLAQSVLAAPPETPALNATSFVSMRRLGAEEECLDVSSTYTRMAKEVDEIFFDPGDGESLVYDVQRPVDLARFQSCHVLQEGSESVHLARVALPAGTPLVTTLYVEVAPWIENTVTDGEATYEFRVNTTASPLAVVGVVF